MKKLALVTTVFGLALTPAIAQQTRQEGLVNVNVANVLNDLNVDVSNNTVQVPIGVAANVCGVNANVLAQQATGGATPSARQRTCRRR